MRLIIAMFNKHIHKRQKEILQVLREKMCTDEECEMLEGMGLPVTPENILLMMERNQAESTQDLISYSQRHSIATPIMNCMYGVFLTHPSENIGDRHGIQSIAEHIARLERCTSTEDWVVEDFAKRIFKGVNKRLQLPCIISKLVLELELPAFKAKNVVKESLVVLLQSFDIVRFNVKNLIKYYGFPEVDAKALYSNLAIYNRSTPLYLPKNVKHTSRILPITYDNTNNSIKVFWDVPSMLVDNNVLEYINYVESESPKESDLDEILSALDKPLPIEDLNFWKVLAKEFYEAGGDDWSVMPIYRQKRLLTNFIRHNIPGYSHAYRLNDRVLAQRLHDRYFDMVMRKIARTFPWLASECTNQWRYREDNNLRGIRKKIIT